MKKKLKEIIKEAAQEKEDVILPEAPADEKASETEADVDATLPMEEDVTLFRELFPDVKAEDIPSSVWERVEKGESLSAAYSLYVIREAAEKKRIDKINEENAEKAPPRIRHDGAESDYFSPEAVKAMTRSEIKKHYDAILKSMESWN